MAPPRVARCRPAEHHLEPQLAWPAVDIDRRQGLRWQHVRGVEIEGGKALEALDGRELWEADVHHDHSGAEPHDKEQTCGDPDVAVRQEYQA